MAMAARSKPAALCEGHAIRQHVPATAVEDGLPENMFDLTGKVSLVTGANSGLGFGFARGLARSGSDVVIWGARADKNEDAAAKLRAYGVRVSSAAIDVTDDHAIIDGVDRIVQDFGRLDVV